MIVRDSNEKSPSNDSKSLKMFRTAVSSSQCMSNIGSLRQFESLKDLIKLMTIKRKGEVAASSDKCQAQTQRIDTVQTQGSSQSTVSLSKVNQSNIKSKEPIRIPVIKSDNFDMKCKSLLKSIMLSNEDYIDKPKVSVHKLMPL